MSTHLRLVERYYFQVTPWVLYFAAAAVVAAVGAGAAAIRRPALVAAVASCRCCTSSASTPRCCPARLRPPATQTSSGRQQFGPADPLVIPIFEAVLELTPPDAVITYFRARTMTLLTDRLAIQTPSLDRVLQRADYFAQLRNATYAQPDVTPFEARRLGFEEVWADAKWMLWKVPALGSAPEEAAADGG